MMSRGAWLAGVLQLLLLVVLTASPTTAGVMPASRGRMLLEQLASVATNYSMIATDISYRLWYKANLTAPWTTKDERLPWPPYAILPLRDGTVLASSSYDWMVYKRSPGSSTWDQIPGSCCVFGLGITSDGRLVHAGSDGSIWAKPTTDITSGWQSSPLNKNMPCGSVSFLANGSAFCKRLNSDPLFIFVNGTWQPLNETIPLSYVTAYGNLIVGLSADGGSQLVRLPSLYGPITNYSSWKTVSKSPPNVQLVKIAAVPPASVTLIDPRLYPEAGLSWIKMFH